MTTPAHLIGDITDAVDRIADDERTPEVAAVVKRKLPTKVRRAIYNVGVVLGTVAAFGGILAASLEGKPGLLAGSLAGAAYAVSSLISKSHIAD